MSKADITSDMIAKFHRSLANDKAKLAMNNVANNGYYGAAKVYQTNSQVPTVFDIEIDTKGITDQKSSGRCWLFAVLNDLRHEAQQRLKVEDFEFSAAYCYFWDLLEKANVYLENSIRYANRSYTDRLFQTNKVRTEGGWPIYAANVINKYGLVPKDAMPETINSENSRSMGMVLERVQRKYGLELRKLAQKDVEEAQRRKIIMLDDIYRILVAGLGEPPAKFNWSYKDKKKNYIELNNITPLEFKKKVVKPVRYVTIINNPALEYNKLYKYQNNTWQTNMIDKNNMVVLNLYFDKIRQLAVQQLKDKKPVLFTALVSNIDTRIGKSGDSFMKLGQYDFDNLLDIDTSLSKADAAYTEGTVDHEMLITGATLDKNKPIWWKVENSWGGKVGDKGYFTMSDDWFARYAHDISLPKRDLPANIAGLFKQKPITRKPWEIL